MVTKKDKKIGYSKSPTNIFSVPLYTRTILLTLFKANNTPDLKKLGVTSKWSIYTNKYPSLEQSLLKSGLIYYKYHINKFDKKGNPKIIKGYRGKKIFHVDYQELLNKILSLLIKIHLKNKFNLTINLRQIEDEINTQNLIYKSQLRKYSESVYNYKKEIEKQHKQLYEKSLKEKLKKHSNVMFKLEREVGDETIVIAEEEFYNIWDKYELREEENKEGFKTYYLKKKQLNEEMLKKRTKITKSISKHKSILLNTNYNGNNLKLTDLFNNYCNHYLSDKKYLKLYDFNNLIIRFLYTIDSTFAPKYTHIQNSKLKGFERFVMLCQFDHKSLMIKEKGRVKSIDFELNHRDKEFINELKKLPQLTNNKFIQYKSMEEHKNDTNK